MNDHPLEELLRAAGRTDAEPPPMRSDLADRVRRQDARRRRTRKVVGAVSVVLLLIGGVATALQQAKYDPRPTDSPQADRAEGDLGRNVERFRAEMARLEAEMQRRRQILDRMVQHEQTLARAVSTQDHADVLDLLERAQIEIEKTAFLLVHHADQEAAYGRAESSAAGYRRILERFPDTNGARTAQARLGLLSPEQGDL